MKMSPLQIKMLLHFFCTTEAIRPWGTAESHAIEDFAREGLIHPNDTNEFNHDMGFRLTERGEAYIRFLCDMPLPEVFWMVPPWAPSHPREED